MYCQLVVCLSLLVTLEEEMTDIVAALNGLRNHSLKSHLRACTAAGVAHLPQHETGQ